MKQPEDQSPLAIQPTTHLTNARLLNVFLGFTLQLLMLFLQLSDLCLVDFAGIDGEGFHPVRVEVLDVQIRADVLFVDEGADGAHAQEGPGVLLAGAEIFDLKVLVARHFDGLDVVQATAGPDGVDAAGLVVLVPGATVVDPDGVPDPLLAVLVERVRDVLLRRQRRNVLALDLLDDLQRVHADLHQRAHHATVLHRPVGPDERQEVGEVRDRQPQVPFRADLPFLRQLDSVLPHDREAWTVRHVEARRTNNRVDFHACAVFANHARLVNLHDFCEVDIDVVFLYGSV